MFIAEGPYHIALRRSAIFVDGLFLFEVVPESAVKVFPLRHGTPTERVWVVALSYKHGTPTE